MKKRVFLMLGAALVLLSLVPGTALSAGHRVIDSGALKSMISDGKGVVIVDVREPWRFKRGHIPGAINIPFDGAHERVAKELPRSKRIVFVCHGGPMGDELGRLLVKNGFKKVYNLRGGMRGWPGPLER